MVIGDIHGGPKALVQLCNKLEFKDGDTVWSMLGGNKTTESYEGFTRNERAQHLSFLESMSMCHLENENRLFIHAGFTFVNGVEKEIFKTTFYF